MDTTVACQSSYTKVFTSSGSFQDVFGELIGVGQTLLYTLSVVFIHDPCISQNDPQVSAQWVKRPSVYINAVRNTAADCLMLKT